MGHIDFEKSATQARKMLADYGAEQAKKPKESLYNRLPRGYQAPDKRPAEIISAERFLISYGKIEQAQKAGRSGSELNRMRAEFEFRSRGGTTQEWNDLIRYEEGNRAASQRQSASIKAGGRAAPSIGYDARPVAQFEYEQSIDRSISEYIDKKRYSEIEESISFFDPQRNTKLIKLASRPPLKAGYVYYDEGGAGTETFGLVDTGPTEAEIFAGKVSDFEKTLTRPTVAEPAMKYFSIEDLYGGYENIRGQQEQRIFEIEQLTDPVEKAARFEVELPAYKEKADEIRYKIENYPTLFRGKVESLKAEQDWETPTIGKSESYKLEDLSNIYNEAVGKYNVKALEITSIGDPVERQARIEEELAMYDEPVQKYKSQVDKFINFYNTREPENLEIGEIERSFKGISRARGRLESLKAEKLKRFEMIEDPIERQVAMEQDLPQFEDTEKQLKQFRKVINVETTQQLEELNAGGAGILGGPTTPADSPTGSMYVPMKKVAQYQMSLGISKDPLSIAGDYFKPEKHRSYDFGEIKMPKLNRRFF